MNHEVIMLQNNVYCCLAYYAESYTYLLKIIYTQIIYNALRYWHSILKCMYLHIKYIYCYLYHNSEVRVCALRECLRNFVSILKTWAGTVPSSCKKN